MFSSPKQQLLANLQIKIHASIFISRAFKSNWEFLHILPHYKAVSPLIDEICT